MIMQPVPSFEPLVFVVSLSWAVISAMLLTWSIKMEYGSASWLWVVSLVVSSVIAGVSWRLL